MNTTPPPIQALAQRLLTFEVKEAPSYAHIDEAVRICDKLRLPLSKLTGVAGFQALLSRALALAKGKVPALNVIQVSVDGSLTEFAQIKQSQDVAAEKAGIVLVVKLLELLVTFIGISLTLRILIDCWPAVSIDRTDLTVR